jgi:DivIVA domain-containing protein
VTDREALADSVTAARFPSTRFRRGYAAGDVDPFLTDLAAAVRAGVAVQARIDGARFKQSYGGYDMGAVDDFLDRTGAAAATAGSDAPAAPATDRPAANVVAADSPSAISRGENATAGPARVIPVVVTMATYGVVAGIAAVVVRNVRPGTSLPVWPVVAVGCVVGLVYELAARVVRARRR